MKIGGHQLREHVRLLVPLFAFIALVWALRLFLDKLGFPGTIVTAMSVTVATSVSVLIAVVLIHVRGFGSYPSVVISSILLTCWAELLVVLAIVFSVTTGIETIFTAPEFSLRGDDPHHLRHIFGHLTFGVGLGALTGSAFGCLILWMLRRMVPDSSRGT